jgi:hypothetical protein
LTNELHVCCSVERKKSSGFFKLTRKSVNYLLHTNACIALINGKPPSVRHKMTLVTANSKEFRRVKGLVWEIGESDTLIDLAAQCASRV